MDLCKLNDENGCSKISSNLQVSYSYGSLVSSGKVTAISKRCMCVNTNIRLPLYCSIKLLRRNNNGFDIRVKVERVKYVSRIYKLSLEVINPPLDYLNIVNRYY